MFPVTFWVQLLLLILALRQSAAASDLCSELREQISRLDRGIGRITEQKHNWETQTAECQEKETKQIHISRNTEEPPNNMKKELEAKEEILKNITDKQTQMHTAIDGLTKTVESLNQKADLESGQWKAMQTAIVGLTKTVESLNQKADLESGHCKAVQTDINGLTKTVESINLRSQVLCRTQKDVCRVLLEAAKSGDVNTAKVLFKCSNYNFTDDGEDQLTPLMCAGGEGHVEVVRVLPEEGTNTEILNDYGSTALHLAASKGRLDICRLLLDWGAKVNARNKNGDTPLHDAAHWGYLSIVKLLVERGADISLTNKKGQTARDAARSQGKKAVADWLDSVSRRKGR